MGSPAFKRYTPTKREMEVNIKEFAIKAHADVNHLYDGKPYSEHLEAVVFYANKYMDSTFIPRPHQETVVNACWLHDVIEDCRLTYNDVKRVAGEEVAEIVYALTNEKGRTRAERAGPGYYFGIRVITYAAFVKLCDRLANVAYSKKTTSRMLGVYRRENEEFLEKLLGLEREYYQEMVVELKEMLT